MRNKKEGGKEGNGMEKGRMEGKWREAKVKEEWSLINNFFSDV